MARITAHERAAHLLADRRRRVLGIAGAPGAGKSTLATEVAAALGGAAAGVVVVGMDGWHLANSTLDRLGRRERKGAPDTFDAPGYVEFLRRVRAGADLAVGAPTVWAPEYRREIEEGIAGAVEVGPGCRLLVTEGNYLLHDEPPWDAVAPLLDEVWFVAPEEDRRREWLVARHERHGRSRADAEARADGPDAVNAALVARGRDRADLVISDDLGAPGGATG